MPQTGRSLRRRCLGLATLVAGLLVLPAPYAAADFIEDPDDRGAFTILFENDIFGAFGHDRHYTQGVRFSFLTREDRVWDWVRDGARALPFYPDGGVLRPSWSLGQNLYTPEDITTTELVEDDRPYAAWLYLAVGLIADTRRSLDTVEFSIGMVGPAALGETLQSWFHGMIASPDPQGWHNQLSNEPTLQLFYERKWRQPWAPSGLSALGLRTDVTPHVGGALGNVYIQASAGGTLRIGTDLPADYGAPRIRPSLPGSEFFVPSKNFSAYLFAGIEGRAVARNIFLDGNTFTDSHSVQKYPLVGDFQGGIAAVVLDVRLSFTYVIRSREFVKQDEVDKFGAIALSIRI